MKNIKISILKLLLSKKIFDSYSDILDSLFLADKDLSKLYLSIKDYYENSEKDLASVDNLELNFNSLYPFQQKKDINLIGGLFDRIRDVDVDPSIVEKYINALKRQEKAHELAIQAIRITEGKEPSEDIIKLAESIYSEKEEQKDTGDSFIVTESLSELLSSELVGGGLNWRLNCMNESLGPLRKGDFGFIFKRPETGGTTFLASEGSHMIKEMSNPLVWINNEEGGKKVKLRFIQAYYGVTVLELQKNLKDYEETFNREVGDKLVIRDDFRSDVNNIHAFLRHIEPDLIMIDQLDKLTGQLIISKERKDLEHGLRYRWAREIAKEFAPVIGVSQASATAENKKWLTMDDVADAKTSKQAEADWIMGIGAIHAMGQENFRFFSLCKNKLMGSEKTVPELRHGKTTTVIQPHRARYIDV